MPKEEKVILKRKRTQIDKHSQHKENTEIFEALRKQDSILKWLKEEFDRKGIQSVPKDHPANNWKDGLVKEGYSEIMDAVINNNWYNPGGETRDHSQPWYYKMTPAKATNILVQLSQFTPSWAKRHEKGTIDGISDMRSSGYIGVDKHGQPYFNKGGQNFCRAREGRHHTLREERLNYAIKRVINDILEFNGGKSKIPNWDVSEFRNQMKNSISRSTPGYPYNGIPWSGEIDGKSVVDCVYDLGVKSIEDGYKQLGYIYFPGTRKTADAGNKYSGSGNARGVFQAPSSEKLGVHELAFVFKQWAKGSSVLSGQRGIQEVSRNAKKLRSGELKGEHSSDLPVYAFAGDISRWDAAALIDPMMEMVTPIFEAVLDLEDEWTSKVYSWFNQSFKDSYIITPIGPVKVKELPSGSSMTTILAFILQWIYWYEIVYEIEHRGYKNPLVSTGFQGDDILVLMSYWEDEFLEIISSVYADHLCDLKDDGTGFNGVSNIAQGEAAVFLNESILISSPETSNFRPIRGGLFFREDVSRPNLDPMLMKELATDVAHLSTLELQSVSLVSKISALLSRDEEGNWIMNDEASYKRWKHVCTMFFNLSTKHFPIRSWMSERALPNDPTRLEFERLEKISGKYEEDPAQRAIQREEEPWLMGDDLKHIFTALCIFGERLPETRPAIRRIVKFGKSDYRSKRKARNALSEYTKIYQEDHKFDNEIDLNLQLEVTADLLKGAMDVIIKGQAESWEASHAVDESAEITAEDMANVSKHQGQDQASNRETIASTVLALNISNPATLLKLAARVIIQGASSPDFKNNDKVGKKERMYIAEAFEQLYGTNLYSYLAELEKDKEKSKQ